MTSEQELRIRDEMFRLEQLEKTILGIVNSNTGIKGVELVVKTISKFHPKSFETTEFLSIVQALVLAGEIVELEYEVPQVQDRIKSIYFPKGTSFKLALI